jgi:glycosyltransferase-like protein LARGE
MKDPGGGGGPSSGLPSPSSSLPTASRFYDPKRKRAADAFRRLVLVPIGVFFGAVALLAVARLAHGGAGAEDATAAVWQSLREPPAALYRCMNEGSSVQQTTYEDFARGAPVRLRLRRAWWSRRPLPAAQAPLTIATGLNPGRLDQLESQCQSWGGPLSAAVYLVLPQYEGAAAEGAAAAAAAAAGGAAAGDQESEEDDGVAGLTPASRAALAEAERAVAQFHARAERGEGGMRCRLDAMLLYETVADARMAVLLPINAMRNYALLQARSPLVAMVDVDLVVSAALGEWLARPANVELLRAGAAARRVFVLPAFETAPQDNATLAHELADGAARMAKPALASLTAARLVYQFALYLFRQGHNCTDYPRWFRSDAPYDIAPYDGYEPWFATARLANPFYDAVYRGYGW